MTTDDKPIPGFDGIARAARLGLGQLASADAPRELSWDAVQTGARRVQRGRLAVIGAACAIFLLGGSAAVAAVGRDSSNRVSVVGSSVSTTTTEGVTSSTTAPPTTTSTPGTSPGVAESTTTVPAWLAPIALTTDLEGTLTLASTTMVAEQPTSFTLTVRNVADHTIRIDGDTALDVWIDSDSGFGGVYRPGLEGDTRLVLAPGVARTFTSEIAPNADMVGDGSVRAVLLGSAGPRGCDACSPAYIAGIPSVAVTVIPPGWVEGQPLDPSQGSWDATMAADATDVHVGDAITVHATLRNTGDQVQITRGYAALAIACEGIVQVNHLLDTATVQPGAKQTFAGEFRFAERFVGGDEFAVLHCSVGISFPGHDGSALPRLGIESDSVAITVLRALEPTTTTAPDAATSTTTP